MSACPICGKVAGPRTSNASAPFCSPRCKQIDLGKWLSQEYAMPAQETSLSEEEGALVPESEAGKKEKD
jgi:endogenous inhibitor of DNA gyrase (YacG/DUF329 family)